MMEAGTGIGGFSKNREELVASKFDLFSHPEYETGVKKLIPQTFRPISTSTSQGPYSFVIPSDPEKLTDTGSIRLHGKMCIKKRDSNGSLSILAGENVSTVNNIFSSLWSSINTKLNGTEISDPTSSWYAYKSYLENHLSYSTGVKNKVVSSKGYFEDSKNAYDNVASTTNNEGFKKRKRLFEQSRWVYFCINLHIDITTLHHYLLPGIKIEIDLHRNTDAFCLLSDDTTTTFAIELDDIRLSLNRMMISGSVHEFYLSALKNNKIPRSAIDRSLLKTYTVTKGRSELSENNIITGSQLPEQVFVVIVDEDAHRGVINKNPFNFRDYDITHASLVVNGVHEPPDQYKLDKSTGDIADLYAQFLENTGISIDDREIGISIEDYYGGSFILAWDRTQDKCNRFHRHMMDSGSMSINIKTKTPLEKTVTVIIYATYSRDLEFDGDRVITEAF